MNTKALATEMVAIDDLHLNPANPRFNDEAVPHVRASLERFGWQQPIVAKQSGEVVAGNTRLKAALEMGVDEVPVVWFEGSDLDATAFSIADNKTSEFAMWDEPALASLLQHLQEEDSLDGVGYSDVDVEELLASLVPEEDVELDDPGPGVTPEKPIAKTGDLWILGEHRLLCGDSTKLADVQRVMAGDKAALVATDPPYAVDYVGDRPNDSGKDWSHVYKEVDIEDAEQFFRSTFENIVAVMADHCAVYAWHAHRRQALLSRIWEEVGLLDHQQIIWVKPVPVFGRTFWHFQHEPCLFGWRKGSKPEHDGSHEHSSVWTVDWEGKARFSTDHPTSKPVELFLRPMKKHSRKGAICFEPFSGSGSQLIAAERSGRVCRAIEIEPAFVDVAVQRWEAATGRTAVLEKSENPSV